MSRWFRWYEGTSEDGKFRVVARMSRVTIRDVIALWAFILEDAAHLDHRGVCKRNEDFMASILDFEDGVVERILEAMESADMISVGHGAITICNWGKRQFEGDTDPTAADRQARKRAKDKETQSQPSHADVTRDSRPPETEADTETNTEKKEGPSLRSGGARSRGTRLPEEFALSEADIEFAAKHGFVGDPLRRVFSDFCDYWHARAGPQGVKLDWPATWRRWIRTEADKQKNRRQPSAAAQDNGFKRALEGLRNSIDEDRGGQEVRPPPVRLLSHG